MNTTRKIAVSCFLGGATLCAVAFVVTPNFFWLAILAGVASGYLSYEFKDVGQAVSDILRQLWRNCGDATRKFVRDTCAWFSGSHPITYSIIGFAFPFWVYSSIPMWLEMTEIGSGINPLLVKFVLIIILIMFTILLGLVCFVFSAIIILALAKIGSKKGYWLEHNEDGNCWMWEHADPNTNPNIPAKYENILGWAIRGIGVVIVFLCWTMWKYLFVGVRKVIYLALQCLWMLIEIIHSEKRVLCAIDGALGGFIVYVYQGAKTSSLSEQIAVIICGGLLGAAIGVCEYRLVQKLFARRRVGA